MHEPACVDADQHERGLSDSEENALTVQPVGVPSSVSVVMTVTPEANCPMALRIAAGPMAAVVVI